MTTFAALRDDPRTAEALTRLRRRGLAKELEVELLQLIVELPKASAALRRESPEKRRQRRARLAKRMRGLASAMDKDREAKYIRIIDSESITQSKIIDGKEVPTFADFLRSLAETYERSGSADDDYSKFLEGKSTTRVAERDFVKREIFAVLADVLKYPRRPPNIETSLLANAVLGLHGQGKIKPNDIARLKHYDKRPHHGSPLDSFLLSPAPKG